MSNIVIYIKTQHNETKQVAGPSGAPRDRWRLLAPPGQPVHCLWAPPRPAVILAGGLFL